MAGFLLGMAVGIFLAALLPTLDFIPYVGEYISEHPTLILIVIGAILFWFGIGRKR